MAPSAGRRHCWTVLASVVLIVGACSSPTSSPSLGATAAPSASPSATASSPIALPTVTESPFVAANVRVSLEPYAKVPGSPLAIVAPDDGSGRLLVATQEGLIWAVTNGVTADHPMLDISARITSGGERGLLGIAVHPGFPTDPRIFVDYTDGDGNTVVSSFRMATGDPTRFDPSIENVILRQEQPFPNHNGGAVVFGPDGALYITLGDGGSGGDPQGNGQNLDTLLGKILRIDIDHPDPADGTYGISADNPFVGRNGARPEIWLYGLRNPWRISFDRRTSDLWIGDVGQDRWEEVDVVPDGQSGLNFGWNVMEGDHCFQPAQGCDQATSIHPIAEYGHDQGCTIIGGYVYRGSAYPILRGGYLFADYCSGTIFAITAIDPTTSRLPVAVGETDSGVSAFGEDAAGELYVANLDGTISRVTAASR
jgi:glucose/arabinose dehydrogenase